MEFLDRTPPYSIEAEMAVLSALLADKETIPVVLESLSENDFYSEKNRQIFSAIKMIINDGAIPDLVTLTHELKRQNLFDEIGPTYISSLLEYFSSSANIEYYTKIVKEKSILRELIRISSEIMEESYRQTEDITKLLDKSQSMIFSLATKGDMKKFRHINELLPSMLDRIEMILKEHRPVGCVNTGFDKLDELLGGLHPSQFIIIAGRPRMGKTSFVTNILLHVGLKQNLPAVFFSLEMSKEEVMFRLICSEARVNSHLLRSGKLKKGDVWRHITNASERLMKMPLYIDDTSDISVFDLRLRARKLAAELENEKLSLIVIDYLQMLRGIGRYDSKQQEVADISRSLKNLAKELNIPVVAVSQLSRRPEEREREGKRPQLSDLRESGALEQDADVVIFVHRPGLYKPDSNPEERSKTEIIVEKQRHGPMGKVILNFREDWTRFEKPEFEPEVSEE